MKKNSPVRDSPSNFYTQKEIAEAKKRVAAKRYLRNLGIVGINDLSTETLVSICKVVRRNNR